MIELSRKSQIEGEVRDVRTQLLLGFKECLVTDGPVEKRRNRKTENKVLHLDRNPLSPLNDTSTHLYMKSFSPLPVLAQIKPRVI